MLKYLKRADCHGITWTLNESSTVLRVLWTFCIVSSVCIAVYYSIHMLLGFKNSPTFIESTKINVDNLSFPKILLCNPDIVNYSRLAGENFPPKIVDLILNFYFTNYEHRAFGVVWKRREMYDQMLNDTNVTKFLANFSIKSFLEEYGYSCEQTLVQCLVSNVIYDKCCEFSTSVFHALYGRCFLLNSDLWAQKHVSSTAGITLTVAVLTSDSTGVTKFPSLVEGVYLEMFDYYEYASLSGYNFWPNSSALMSLKQTRYRRSKASKVGCLTSLESGVTSSAACHSVCWVRQYQANCNCTKHIGYYPPPNVTLPPVCNTLEALKCMAINQDQYTENYEKCLRAYCRPLCDEVVYTSDVSILPLKMNRLRNYSNPHYSSANGNTGGMVRINIIYHSIQYTSVAEFETLTFQNILSLLGGQVGFWFGGSVLTLIQFFYIFTVGVSKFLRWLLMSSEEKVEVDEKGRKEKEVDKSKTTVSLAVLSTQDLLKTLTFRKLSKT